MKFALRAPRRFRLILLLGVYLGGLALGSQWAGPDNELVAHGGVFLLGVLILLKNYWVGIFCGCLGMLLLGYYWGVIHLKQATTSDPLKYEGNVQVLSVRFRTPPQQRVIFKLLEGEKRGMSFQAYTYDFIEAPGTVVRISATIQPSKYVSDRGRNVIGSSSDVKVVTSVSKPGLIYTVRSTVTKRVGQTLPEPYASLAVGLLTGAGDEFDTTFKEDLQRTGTTHLVAVSGYNLTIVALLLQRLGQRKGRWFGFWLACSSLVFYIILAGANPSILRGAAVAFLSLLALVTGRVAHRVPLVLLSAALLSIITPLGMLYSLSWQLSFLAFTGIIFLSPLLAHYFSKFGTIGQSMGDTLGAELMTLPLILYQFGTLSVIAPFVNAAVLGFVPLAMGLSALQAGASLVSLGLGRVIAWISYPSLWIVVKPIQWSSLLPYAAYDVGHYTLLYFVLTYALVGGLFIWLTLNNNETT